LGFFPAGGSAVAIAAEPLFFFKFSFCEATGFEGRILTDQPHHAFPADGVPKARRHCRQTCQFTIRCVSVWRRPHPLQGKIDKQRSRGRLTIGRSTILACWPCALGRQATRSPV